MKPAYTFPPLDELELDNGLKVIGIAHHEQNGVVAAVQVPVGCFSDPPGLEGLCELTAALLAKGTESMTAEEFAERSENAGASLFIDAGEEYCIIGMRMQASSASSLLPNFAEMFVSPRFAEEEFLRLKREMATSLKAESSDPLALATRHFFAELAGRDHPAGRLETVRSLRKITLGDVKSFFKDFFSPAGALLVVGGDLDRTALKEAAVSLFPPWRRDACKKAAAAPPLPPRQRTTARIIDKKDLTQATFIAGHVCPGERCPDKTALLLANHILGGGNFSSRLMTRLRSTAGRTYGVSSQLSMETDFGAFMMTTATRYAEFGTVLDAAMEEYRRFCRDGVTAGELDNAKQYVIGNMAFQLEGIGNIVDKLLWLRFYGRKNSYIEGFTERISSVSLTDVNDAIRRHLSPDGMVITAVGNAAEIGPPLSHFGPVRRYHFRDKA